MGCGPGKYHKVHHDPMEKVGTVLTEIRIGHLRDAHAEAAKERTFYNGAVETVVSIVPSSAASRCCCIPLCWIGVPDGFSAMVTRFGKDIEGKKLPHRSWDNQEDEPKGGRTFEPGCHCICCWHKVQRLVSQQDIVFDTPVRSCRTKDDVSVDIDVLVCFCITDARTFMYELGPDKLDQLLRATQEETLRTMIGGTLVDEIYDLYGEDTKKWVDEMNSTFNPFGVKIKYFIVKNVGIPQEMALNYEQTTLYTSKSVEKEKKLNVDLLAIKQEEEKEELGEMLANEQMKKEQETLTIRAEMGKECSEIEANAAKDVTLAETQRLIEIQDMETNAMLNFAKIEAETMKLKREVTSKLELEIGKLEAEAAAYVKEKDARSRMESLEKLAEGKKEIAEAEGKAVEAFRLRRQQETELARLNVLEKLALNKNIKIASSQENNSGLAPDNSLVAQVAQQGLEAVRMKLAEMTAASAAKLDMGKSMQGGLIRPVPPQQKM